MRNSKIKFGLIWQKAISDLVAESRRGYLGVLWWVVEPILYMSAFYLIFTVIFERGDEHRVAFLLIGLVTWKWFAVSIPQCANCLVSNIGLIRMIYVPKYIFIGMVVVTSSIRFSIIFLLLLAYLIMFGYNVNASWISLPLILLAQMLTILAVGSVFGAIVPFVPDLKMIIENLMFLLFFLSGVFFDVNLSNSEFVPYLYINPMLGIIESYRDVLIYSNLPDIGLLIKIVVFSTIGFLFGLYLMHRYDRVYAKVI